MVGVTQGLSRTTLVAKTEICKWIKTPFEGLVQTVQELEARFVIEKTDAPVIKKEPKQEGGCGYDVYSQMQHNGMQRLAYGCHSCEKIVLGHPKIEVKSETKTLEFYCVLASCNVLLEKRVTR